MNKKWLLTVALMLVVFLFLQFALFKATVDDVNSKQAAIDVLEQRVQTLESRLKEPQTPGALPPATKAGKVELHRDFDVTLEPGGWQGFSLGPSNERCAYVAEVTPVQTSRDGASIERMVIQPECDGKKWTDVLRIRWPGDCAPITANIRVYKITGEKTAPWDSPQENK
jgi:hypothetical protein